MSKQNKPKFLKAKLQPSLVYHEWEEEHKKNAPNPCITKLDLIDKEEIEIVLQREWDQKV